MTTPIAELGARYAQEQHPGTEAQLSLTGETASAAGAALANGFLANALDYDDGHRGVSGHPGAVIIPAVLAIADKVAAPRDEVLTAILIGYEVAVRAGYELHRRSDPFYYHGTGAWGCIGATAAVARLLQLSRIELGNALGASEYHAPMSLVMRSADDPAMTKDSCGWGAYVAVTSGLLAKAGFTATSSIFGKDNMAHQDLSSVWLVKEIYVKPYPCCRWTHAALAAAESLSAIPDFDPRNIDEVTIRTFAAAAELNNGRVHTTEEAQYSLTWPVACSLVRGKFGLDTVIGPLLDDPHIRAVQERTRVHVDPEFTASYPNRRFAQVSVRFTDGTVRESAVNEPVAEPEDSRWPEVINDKVRRFAPWLDDRDALRATSPGLENYGRTFALPLL